LQIIIFISLCCLVSSPVKRQARTGTFPTKIANIEIGSGNNGQGIIGRYFHLDMDLTAGD